MTELEPIRLSAGNISGLYFHDEKTDMLYRLKNEKTQSKCEIWGLREELHLTEDDLIQHGKLQELKNRIPFVYVIPMYSY